MIERRLYPATPREVSVTVSYEGPGVPLRTTHPPHERGQRYPVRTKSERLRLMHKTEATRLRSRLFADGRDPYSEESTLWYSLSEKKIRDKNLPPLLLYC